MWVRVQDKNMLVEPKIIELTKGIMKKSKWSITGKVTNSTDEFLVTLGVYDTEEVAERVFSEIEQALVSDRRLFIMPDSQGM